LFILNLSKEDIKIFAKEIMKTKALFPGYIFENSEHSPKKEINNCGAGIKGISISPNGNVKLCPMDSGNIFAMGNIFSDELKSLFIKNPDLKINEIQVPQKKICGD
jgi:MoaA/NifB/PqqE/SkfB family radical SAM enzyme